MLFWYQGDSDDALIDTTYSSRTQKKFGTCCAANPSVYRKKRPAGGWDHGTCKATYVVERDGKVVLKRDLELPLWSHDITNAAKGDSATDP